VKRIKIKISPLLDHIKALTCFIYRQVVVVIHVTERLGHIRVRLRVMVGVGVRVSMLRLRLRLRLKLRCLPY